MLGYVPKKYRDAMKEASKHLYPRDNKLVPTTKLYSLNITINDLDIDFNFNDQLFEQYVKDLETFNRGYYQAKRKVDQQFAVSLEDAYKTFLAKLYLEYGETFGPVFDAWADMANSFKFTGCDTSCVA